MTRAYQDCDFVHSSNMLFITPFRASCFLQEQRFPTQTHIYIYIFKSVILILLPVNLGPFYQRILSNKNPSAKVKEMFHSSATLGATHRATNQASHQQNHALTAQAFPLDLVEFDLSGHDLRSLQIFLPGIPGLQGIQLGAEVFVLLQAMRWPCKELIKSDYINAIKIRKTLNNMWKSQGFKQISWGNLQAPRPVGCRLYTATHSETERFEAFSHQCQTYAFHHSCWYLRATASLWDSKRMAVA